jgi:uncharacterized protein involved in tolerance to divalent cations
MVRDGAHCAAAERRRLRPILSSGGVRSVSVMNEVLCVYTAAGSLEVARRLVQGAVRERLAAGGQVVGPIESAYWHEASFGTGQEWQVALRSFGCVRPGIASPVTPTAPCPSGG